MSRPTLLLSLLLSSSTLTACGDPDLPDAGDAKFSSLSDERVHEALDFALGTGAIVPFFATLSATAANSTDEACPARTADGRIATFSADDCVNAGDGARYDGRLVATNAFSFEDLLDSDVVPGLPMSVEADGWRAGDLELDGSLRQSVSLPEEGQAYDADVDYTAVMAGQTLAYEGTAACVRGEGCLVDAFADTPDGSFAIDGDLTLDGERPRGLLVMRGVDELRLDLDALGADRCAPYTIDGRDAGTYCFPVPEPEPELSIWGAGFGCGSENGVAFLDLSAFVKGTPTTVSMRVIEPATGIEDTFSDLDERSYDAENDVHQYDLTVNEGESDLTPCADREYAYAITATNADGVTVCASFGDHPELFPDCPAWQ